MVCGEAERRVVMRSSCAGAALDPPLIMVPNQVLSLSFSLTHAHTDTQTDRQTDSAYTSHTHKHARAHTHTHTHTHTRMCIHVYIDKHTYRASTGRRTPSATHPANPSACASSTPTAPGCRSRDRCKRVDTPELLKHVWNTLGTR
jgi:hypothetical protein